MKTENAKMVLTSTDSKLLRLSQGHLNLLETCPRKFQYNYLEKLTTPTDPKQEKHQIAGSRFHLLMQQREIGLPINSFLEADDKLKTWMKDFKETAPEILTPDINNQTFRESEHYRTLQIQNYLVTVVYDLLIADQEKAHIFDWKTYQKPQKGNDLAKNWQTKLYLYVLAETSTYLLENISMTYWFVQAKSRSNNIPFHYETQKHKQTEKQLHQLLNKLTNWLDDYEKGKPFPQVEESKTCNFCQFAKQCDRFADRRYDSKTLVAPAINNLPNLDIIEEVAL
ncbi:MAG: PD-(D/E)XK nuclease family protein [Sphaerospermopsis kisseleviana]